MQGGVLTSMLRRKVVCALCTYIYEIIRIGHFKKIILLPSFRNKLFLKPQAFFSTGYLAKLIKKSTIKHRQNKRYKIKNYILSKFEVYRKLTKNVD